MGLANHPPYRSVVIGVSLAATAAGFCAHRVLAKAPAEDFRGKVVGVSDGDTLTVMNGRTPVKIRLEAIDAPESSQPHGQKAKQRLSEICFGREVLIRPVKTDRFGRTVAYVAVGKTFINLTMVREGMAWHFVKYNHESRFAFAEAEAMEAGRGVWADKEPLPPWDYRSNDDAAEPLQPGGPGGPAAVAPLPRTRSVSPTPSYVAPRTAAPRNTHWLTLTTGVRHNSGCRYYGKGANGRPCGPGEGKACKVCGG